MELDVGGAVAGLQRLTVKQLRQRYAEVFGEDTNGWSNASPGGFRSAPKVASPTAPANAPANWPTTPTCA